MVGGFGPYLNSQGCLQRVPKFLVAIQAFPVLVTHDKARITMNIPSFSNLARLLVRVTTVGCDVLPWMNICDGLLQVPLRRRVRTSFTLHGDHVSAHALPTKRI